jgi:hypothetical protein
VTRDEVIAVARPALRILDDRLHCADGPAVAWPDGRCYYFWRGVQVPEFVIAAPDSLHGQLVLEERNAEVRRVMIERLGHDRFILETGARPLQADDYGALYRIELEGDEPLVLVHVTNSTPEPDGSVKKYFLRVPPSVRTAREAVAWTFDLPASRYRPERQT